MRTKFISAAAIALALTAASGVASSQSISQKIGNRNIYVTMSAGEDVTIEQFGPLEVFARCIDEGDGFRVEVFFTSNQDGWFFSTSGSLPAGEERLLGAASSDIKFYADTVGNSAVSPSGHYIGVEGETLGLGINVFGHDCLVVGQVVTVRDGLTVQ